MTNRRFIRKEMEVSKISSEKTIIKITINDIKRINGGNITEMRCAIANMGYLENIQIVTTNPTFKKFALQGIFFQNI